MEIKILAFGQIAELVGQSEWTETDVLDTDALKERLMKTLPAIAEVSYLISVDKKLVQENTILNPSSVVGLLPPFSGG